MVFAQLRDWSERKRDDQTVFAVIHRGMMAFAGIKEAMVFPFNLPAITSLVHPLVSISTSRIVRGLVMKS